MIAASNGQLDAVKTLLSAGADTHVEGLHSHTALSLALLHGHEQVAQELRSAGASKEAPDP